MPEDEVLDGYVVRRIMPVEAERLQAFPDGWTDLEGCDVESIVERVSSDLGYGKWSQEARNLRSNVRKWSNRTPDAPRYRAMGNAITTHVLEIIGRRIQAYDTLHYDEVGLR